MAILCISKLPPEVTLDQVQAITKDLIEGGPPAGAISHVVILELHRTTDELREIVALPHLRQPLEREDA